MSNKQFSACIKDAGTEFNHSRGHYLKMDRKGVGDGYTDKVKENLPILSQCLRTYLLLQRKTQKQRCTPSRFPKKLFIPPEAAGLQEQSSQSVSRCKPRAVRWCPPRLLWQGVTRCQRIATRLVVTRAPYDNPSPSRETAHQRTGPGCPTSVP